MSTPGSLFDFSNVHAPQTRHSLEEAKRICETLRQRGHVAYFAGGCVRDALLGREPKDFDVATDAVPERVREIFGKKKTLAFGASFGVIGVLPETRHRSAAGPTEVATFRSDGEYSDGRRPDHVHYGDAKNDALRRDFTINGLFYDPLAMEIIDYVGGQADLAEKRLRTIGEAKQRFEEDKLRMLRAVRFACTLQFALDTETQSEIVNRSDEIAVVSGERIGAEIRRIVASPHAALGMKLLMDCRLDKHLFPQLHVADSSRLERWLQHRTSQAFETSLAIILIAIEHSDASANSLSVLADLAKRWRLSGEESRRIKFAILYWEAMARAHGKPWSQLQPNLIDRDVVYGLDVASTIVRADDLDSRGVDRCRESLQLSPEELNPPALVTGDLLRERGYRPGPEFRGWLQSIRDAQLDGKLKSQEEAIAFLQQIVSGS